MKPNNIEENEFMGAPGGAAGTLNYGTGYGTPTVVHNPNHFAAPKNNHAQNQTSGSSGSPLDQLDKKKSESPLNPEDSYKPQVDQLFKKNNTPSPDEIMSALQYEINQMVVKDKHIAKETVLKNLKKDPQYYSRLTMLNIDDEKMKVTESDDSKFGRTKKVLDEMVAARKSKVIPKDEQVDAIFNEMWERRHGYNKPQD